jgi:hypothetical protein
VWFVFLAIRRKRGLRELGHGHAADSPIFTPSGFFGGVSQGERDGDRVFGAVECGKVEPAERAGWRESGESFIDTGPDAGDQLFSGFGRTPRKRDDFRGFAGLRLRKDFEIDFGGVAEIH